LADTNIATYTHALYFTQTRNTIQVNRSIPLPTLQANN